MPQNSASAFVPIASCELCGYNHFDTVRPWLGVSEIVRCRQCGLQFVNPMPDRAYIQNLYHRAGQGGDPDTDYFLKYIRERKNRNESFTSLYERRLSDIERHCPQKGKILDLGCAAGFFLQSARNRGWQPYGIDIVPQFAEFARQDLGLVDVTCGSIDELALTPETYDAVTLWDLIEHLPQPGHLLKKIYASLRPGGVIILWTPNIKNAVLVREEWHGYLPDHHLYFFSPETLAGFLHHARFQIVHTSTNRAKKGFFLRQSDIRPSTPKPTSAVGKLLHGLRRDMKNFLHPVTYLSPLLDWAGYGFNLYVIARKPAA
jgi:2-polyprenyl-3-methyl-5-hydroxy-6-metoxy-1,4-benzoquinol methylase